MVSFLSFAPAEDAKVLVYVVIDSPNCQYYDSSAAAQIVNANIMDRLMPYYGVPIPSVIIERVEAKLGESLPDLIKGSGRMPDGKGGTKGVSVGKYLRKYIAHRLSGVAKEKLVKESQIDKQTTLAGEVKASEFLLSIGVLFIEWPQGDWPKYPNCEKNIAVLDPSKVKVVQIEEVDLDAKAKYVEGSRRPFNL